MTLTGRDEQFLSRALDLAERGRGRTAPNPLVGAVVARDGRILGEGFHEQAGSDHAEIVALKAAAPHQQPPHFGGELEGVTLYVSLEPCVHHGRTPPCVDTLIAAGVHRVVVGAIDPSPKVSGRGVARLRDAGLEIEVVGGALEHRARRQNGPFRKWSTSGLPFVTYKFAMTLDGKVATQAGDAAWISGEAARRIVHQERAYSDAVVVGAGTMRADDPLLTARGVEVFRQPVRVVVDSRLTIRRDSALAQSAGVAPVLVMCAADVPQIKRDLVAEWGIEVVPVPVDESGRPRPRAVAEALGARGVQSVLLEGGPVLAAAWWNEGLVDKIMAFVAPVVVGGSSAPGPLPVEGCDRIAEALRLLDSRVEAVPPDALITGYLTEPY